MAKRQPGKPTAKQVEQLTRIARESGMVVLSMSRETAEAMIAAIHTCMGDGGDQEEAYKTMAILVAQLELYVKELGKH